MKQVKGRNNLENNHDSAERNYDKNNTIDEVDNGNNRNSNNNANSRRIKNNNGESGDFRHGWKSRLIVLACEVEANPENVSFHWSFNSSRDNEVRLTKFKSKETYSEIVHQIKTDVDYGSFACWAENSIGNTRHACYFHMKPPGLWNFLNLQFLIFGVIFCRIKCC